MLMTESRDDAEALLDIACGTDCGMMESGCCVALVEHHFAIVHNHVTHAQVFFWFPVALLL